MDAFRTAAKCEHSKNFNVKQNRRWNLIHEHIQAVCYWDHRRTVAGIWQTFLFLIFKSETTTLKRVYSALLSLQAYTRTLVHSHGIVFSERGSLTPRQVELIHFSSLFLFCSFYFRIFVFSYIFVMFVLLIFALHCVLLSRSFLLYESKLKWLRNSRNHIYIWKCLCAFACWLLMCASTKPKCHQFQYLDVSWTIKPNKVQLYLSVWTQIHV